MSIIHLLRKRAQNDISQIRIIMWQIVRHIVLSVFIIAILHHLVVFLKDNYTARKTKDVVQFQVQKYQTILEEMQSKQSIPDPYSRPPLGYLSPDEKMSMSADLTEFAQQIGTTPIF